MSGPGHPRIPEGALVSPPDERGPVARTGLEGLAAPGRCAEIEDWGRLLSQTWMEQDLDLGGAGLGLSLHPAVNEVCVLKGAPPGEEALAEAGREERHDLRGSRGRPAQACLAARWEERRFCAKGPGTGLCDLD